MNQDADMDKTAVVTVDADRTQAVPQQGAEATQYAANVDCPVCHTPNPPSETYCIDCGFLLSEAPVAVEVAPEAPSAGTLSTSDGIREFPLKEGENTVGRENADVLLSHPSVSRKHAKVIIENGKAFVEDLGSTNGTCVDSSKVSQGDRAEVPDGAELLFGSSALIYRASPSPQPSPAEGEGDQAEDAPAGGERDGDASSESSVEEADETPEEAVAVEEEPEVEAVVEEDEPAEAAEPEAAAVGRLVARDGSLTLAIKAGLNTIGRRQGANDLVVPDPYASGRHADLAVDDGVFTITDLGSTNGTMVNGVKLDPNAPQELHAGDEVTIGQMPFVLEVD